MKPIQKSGKRKTAIARAVLKQGNGLVRINMVPIDLIQPKIRRKPKRNGKGSGRYRSVRSKINTTAASN